MMRLFIVRHGETDWNVQGRFQGKQDTQLTAHGLAQADRVAAYLAGHEFEAVVSSPLKRALDTANKIAALAPHRELATDPSFKEIDHGDWEGRTADEVRAAWPELLAQWHREPASVKMPGDGGESLADVRDRVMPAVDALRTRYSGDVLLSTHDAVIKVMLCSFFDAPLSSFWRFQVANCSLSIALLADDKPPRVSLMGDAHYLDQGFDLPEQKGL